MLHASGTLVSTAYPFQLCSNDREKGFRCSDRQMCVNVGFTPDHLNFNSFPQALLTVLVCISAEGWSTIMVCVKSWVFSGEMAILLEITDVCMDLLMCLSMCEVVSRPTKPIVSNCGLHQCWLALAVHESQFEAWDSLNHLTSLYFISLMILLSFFAFQLVVVVLCDSFAQTKEEEKFKYDSYVL
jgi:hypothetical protein